MATALRATVSKLTFARRARAGLTLLRHRFSKGTVPPPRAVKTSTIRWLGWRHGCATFVESGTFKGQTLAALSKDFDQLFSIELSADLHRSASERFREEPKIRLLHGDSASVLPLVLAEVRTRCLFWLDGHFSGPGTARADSETPLVSELQTIAGAGRRGDVVLIDDSRLLGTGDYPSLDEVRALLRTIDPLYQIEVRFDMVVAHPPRRRGSWGRSR